MGLCCPKEKYEILEKAQKIKETLNHKKVNKRVHKSFPLMSDLKVVINNKNISKDLKMVLQTPYSDVSVITDSIYLTSIGGLIKENIINYKINCIINVAFETPNFRVKDIECIRIPIDDDSSEDIFMYFNEVSKKLNEISKNKGRALVHCMAGVSRSSTIILAYLMKFKKMSLEKAFIHVISIRPIIKPKIGFFSQLIHFERVVFGKNSVQLISHIIKGNKLVVPDIYVNQYPDLLNKELEEALGHGLQKDKLMDELTERTVL